MLNEKDRQALFATLVELRRRFHQYPELSGQEVRSSAVIQEFLHSVGAQIQTFPNHPGVCGIFRGKEAGPVIALRADMDALPISEDNAVPYRSVHPGVMHACGHDAHMAILLGVAKLLSLLENDFAGTVKMIFQPAEEAAPVGGADAMIQDGVLTDPKVDAIFGLHVWPDLATGQVGIRKGPMMAASDRFRIKVLGKSSHAACPHRGVDAIALATDIMLGLRHVMTRQINPLEAATLSIGTIAGGERYNVVASQASLEGTVRTLSEATRREIPERMKRVLQSITEAHGGSYALEYRFGYPVLQNWPEPTDVVIAAARAIIGCESVLTDVSQALGSEDFSRYLGHVPGAFLLLGAGKAEGVSYPLHSSHFDIDENCLLIGANVLFRTALEALQFYNKERRQVLEPTA